MILLGAGWLGRAGRVGPETSRKIVHMALGMVVLFFPVIFQEVWPVWMLAGIAATALALVRWGRPENAVERQALLGVSRESYGEFCFPLAVALVFTLSHDQPGHYILAIATLAFADAAGAMVGVRVGRIRFYTDEGTKTLEGSAAVFLVTFFASVATFLFVDEADIARSLMAGMLVAGITTLVEAVAVKGFDNLFIPVLVWALAEKYMGLDQAALLIRVLLLVVLLLAAFAVRPNTRLNHAATLGVVLGLYLCAVLAEWQWTLLPAAAVGVYVMINRDSLEAGSLTHSFAAVLAVFGAPLFWLLVHVARPGEQVYENFALALATGTAMIAFTEWAPDTGPPLSELHLIIGRAVLLATIVGLGCSIPLWLSMKKFAGSMLILPTVCMIAVLLLYFGEWRHGRTHRHDRRWLLQGGVSFFLSFAGAVL
jgi:phytol kinase